MKLPRATRLVIGVAREDDARRIMDVLPKRMSKYGLTVHPEKTRLIRFQPDDPADSNPPAEVSPMPRTFDFLGFTHYWGKAWKGGWVIKRKTAKSRLKRAFQALSDWCRINRHEPIAIQHQTLKQKLQGHYGYYGITGNFSSLQEFREGAKEIWKRWLSRRRRAGPMTWPESCAWSDDTGSLKHVWSTACSVAQRIHEMTSPMREIRTLGSVGTRGGQPPWVTRPRTSHLDRSLDTLLPAG